MSVGVGATSVSHVGIHHPIVVVRMRRRMLLLNYRKNNDRDDPSSDILAKPAERRKTYRVPIILCSSMWEIGWKSLMGRIAVRRHMIMIERR